MSKRPTNPRLFSEMDKREQYERDLFQAICDACGWETLTRTARGRANAVVKELIEINATVEQIKTVSRGMRAAYQSDGVVTPQSIVGNWPKFVCGTGEDRRQRKRERMDRCSKRVAAMDRKFVKVAIALLKARKPHVWDSYDYLDTQNPSDDGKRLCVRICELVDSESRDGQTT